jgi:DNA-binding transcriptional regulator YiaG
MDIKDKLVFIRAKLNLSQEALARELNVSYATINRWETGKTTPSRKYEMVIENYCKEKGIIIADN